MNDLGHKSVKNLPQRKLQTLLNFGRTNHENAPLRCIPVINEKRGRGRPRKNAAVITELGINKQRAVVEFRNESNLIVEKEQHFEVESNADRSEDVKPFMLRGLLSSTECYVCDLQQEELTQQIKILRQKSQLAIREAVKSNEKQKENTTGNVTGGVILQEQRHTGRVCTAVQKRSSFDATEWDEQENQTSPVTKRAKMCSPNMGLKGSCESDGFFAGDHFVQHKQRHDRCDSLTTINRIGVNARVDKYKYKVEVVISKRRSNSGSRRRAKKVICSSDFSDDLSELEGAEPSKNIPQLDKDTEPVILDEYSGEKNENTIPKMDINDSSTITTELERPFENIQNAQDQVILSEKMDHEELEMVVNDAGNTIKILEMNEKDRNDGNSNQEFISDMDAEEVQRELAKAVSWHRSATISEVNSKQGVGGGINMSSRYRKCPEYKRIPETGFVVDAFSYGKIEGVTGYFLTHFHSDHYGGLTAKFKHGIIYCSKTTGDLVVNVLKVEPQFVCRLPMNWPILIENSVVTLIDANHCPGSVMLFFDTLGYERERNIDFGWESHEKEIRRERSLHTGDFRASPFHVSALKKTIQVYNSINLVKLGSDLSITNRKIFGFYPLVKLEDCEVKDEEVMDELPPTMHLINKLYLDTTYMDSKYVFPAQRQVIDAVVDLCKVLNSGDRATQLARNNNIRYTNKTIVKSSHMTTERPSAELVYVEPLTKYFGSVKKKLNLLGHTDSKNTKQRRRKRTLFVVGTYLIGKERLFLEVAKSLHSKIYVDNTNFGNKKMIMQIVLEPKDALLLTDDPSMAQIHVVSLHSIKKATMAEYLAKYSEYFDYLVAFRPTGWTFQQTHLNKYGHPNVAESDFNPYRKRLDIPIVDERKRLYEYIKTTMKTGYRQPMLLSYELGNQCVPSNFLSTSAKNISEFSKDSLKPLSRTDNVVIFPVPYSEHSSFRELASFICSINVDTIIPTVFSNASRNTNTNTSSGGSGNTGDAQPSAHSHSHKHKHSHKHGHSHSRNNNHNQSYGHGNNYGNMMAIFQLWNLAKTQVEYSRNQFLSMFSELGRPEAFARYFQSHGICGDTEESLPDNQNIGLLFPEKAVLTIPAKANGQYW